MIERTLISNANYYNSDKDSTELEQADILIENDTIVAVGKNLQTSFDFIDHIIDATGQIVVPGLINAHDHVDQKLRMDHPKMQNAPIDQWIDQNAQLARLMTPEIIQRAAEVKFLELALSGVTHTSVHEYVFPDQYDYQEIIDAVVRAAREVGIGLTYYFGSMSNADLFPKDLVQTSDQIAQRAEDTISHYKQQDKKLAIAIGPCTTFTNSDTDFKNAAAIAVANDTLLQTHLAESMYEFERIMALHGVSPVQHMHGLLEKLGDDRSNVSFAHCIELAPEDIATLAKYSYSVVNSPWSNARAPIGDLGVAPVFSMIAAGVNVALGSDGSPSSGNMLRTMNEARTVQGIPRNTTYLKAHEALQMGTKNGATALDINAGKIEAGMLANIAIFDISHSLSHVGTHDPTMSLISREPVRARYVIAYGKLIISDGQHTKLDEQKVINDGWSAWNKAFSK